MTQDNLWQSSKPGFARVFEPYGGSAALEIEGGTFSVPTARSAIFELKPTVAELRKRLEDYPYFHPFLW